MFSSCVFELIQICMYILYIYIYSIIMLVYVFMFFKNKRFNYLNLYYIPKPFGDCCWWFHKGSP